MRTTMIAKRIGAAASLAFAGGFAATSAWAQAQGTEGLEIKGAPTQGGIGFQHGASELARDIHWLDGMIMIIITAIVLLVVGLLAFVILRYNGRRNPEPSSFTHNSPLEVAWTVVPIAILVFIGAFSLPILFKQQEIPSDPDVTINVTGNQWYWDYEYPDQEIFFSAYMIGSGQGNLNDEIRQELQDAGYSENEFKLAADNAMVVPVGATVVLDVTGGDVIHSWTVPAFGVKQDAVPGRHAHLWFKPDTEGVFFGQCSELCGQDHAYMPITVKVVSQEKYQQWLEFAKEEFPA